MSRTTHRALGAAFALAVVLAAGAAAAQSREKTIDAARHHMELGQASFAEGAFAAAGAHFLDAYDAMAFPAFLYNAGLAAEKGGDAAEAVELYGRYLAEEPGASDRAEIEAKIALLAPKPSGRVEVTEVAPQPQAPPKPAAEQEMKSLVSVRVNPKDARIRIVDAEGREVAAFSGESVKTVVRGAYSIEASHPDYKSVTTALGVVPGQVYVVVLEMSQGAFLGFLNVTSAPPGASVFVDDKASGAVGATPWGNVLPPGKHHLWIEKPGYQPVEREVELAVGDKKALELSLERLPYGELVVKANVPGAKVYLDGRLLGAAPIEEQVPAGRHAMRVVAEDMKDYNDVVDIERGQVTKALVRLNPTPSRTPAWVSGGLAFGVLVAGGVFGGVALHLDRELDADRKAGRLADDDPRIVHGFVWALAADVSFGLGAILASVCIYEFVKDPLPPSEGKVLEPVDIGASADGQPAAAPAPPAARREGGPRFAVAPLVAPDGLGIGFAAAF
jgi:hypothetical protein